MWKKHYEEVLNLNPILAMFKLVKMLNMLIAIPLMFLHYITMLVILIINDSFSTKLLNTYIFLVNQT